MTNSFYKEVIQKIKDHINNRDYEKAFELLNEELKMPYIPKDVEKELLEYKAKLLPHISKEKEAKKITTDDVIDYLNSADKLKLIQAIEELPNLNLRKIAKELKDWIQNNKDDKVTIAFIIENLIDQKVDIDINLDSKSINPKDSKSVLEDPSIIKGLEYIIENTDKQPQLTDLATSEFKRYLLNTYPSIPRDSIEVVKSIINIINNSLNGDNELNEFDKEVLGKLK